MASTRQFTAQAAAMLWLVAATAAAPAQAQVDVGHAQKVVNVVEGAFQGNVRRIVVDDTVRHDEAITTAADSAARLLFVDGSTLSVGPSSSLTLDDFVYDPGRGMTTAVVELSAGVLRFVSGGAGAQAYTFRTPAATIGIRGTIIEIVVRSSGDTILRVLDGTATVRAASNSVAVPAGQQTTVAPGRPPTPPTSLEEPPDGLTQMAASLQDGEPKPDGSGKPDAAGETIVTENPDGSVIVELPDGAQLAMAPDLASQVAQIASRVKALRPARQGDHDEIARQLEPDSTQGELNTVLSLELDLNQVIAAGFSDIAPAAGPPDRRTRPGRGRPACPTRPIRRASRPSIRSARRSTTATATSARPDPLHGYCAV